MTERDKFLAAILADSQDDRPRLIFADALEAGDGGCEAEPERAEFIRVQCELATLIGDGSRCAVCHWPIRGAYGCQPDNCSFRPSERSSEHDGWLRRQKHFHALRCRERELMDARWAEWSRPVPVYSVRLDSGELRAALPVFRRGFVAEITAPWSEWTIHAAHIRAATPLERVKLTTWPETGLPYRPSREATLDYLKGYSPGIEFELPPRGNFIVVDEIDTTHLSTLPR